MMGPDPFVAGFPEKQASAYSHPLVKKRLHRPRTVFYPGHRIRMNVVPILLNLFAPWVLFVVILATASFHLMYESPGLAWAINGACVLVWLCFTAVALWARRGTSEPTWFSYAALACGVMVVSGLFAAAYNYKWYTKPYYEISDLKVLSYVNASERNGEDVMDAGVMYFSDRTDIQRDMSWHFKHRNVFCVVPVMTARAPDVNGQDSVPPLEGMPATGSYDFWAVGEDCCSVSSSDFRCDNWRSVRARAALRVLDEEVLPYYRLAVKQAETLYSIAAAHPVFVKWSRDPFEEVNAWKMRAMKNFLLFSAAMFVVSMVGVTVAVCKFGWIGRTASANETDMYNDASWLNGGYGASEVDYSSQMRA